jgi:aryl-alcohol dehydrogenase-like predicted oxidoreductase
MQTRIFGRTGHASTVAIFGGAVLGKLDQATTDVAVRQMLDAGVNHIDIAPSYGNAETLLGPWMPQIRKDFFLGCKTQKRTKAEAAAEMRESLRRLQVDAFDLFQIHAVTSMEELDLVTGPGGSLEALVEAKQAGLTQYLGITGHGYNSPAVFLEALRRFDFDSVLFPINFVQFADPTYRKNAEDLLAECRRRNVGTMIIKSICRAPWGERERAYHTWYEPFDQDDDIQPAINFALSQDITGICTAGDYRVLPKVLQACENFTPLTPAEQADLVARAGDYAPLFAAPV